MKFRIISGILIMLFIASCGTRDIVKEEEKGVAVTLPPAEQLKLPDLTKKEPDTIKDTKKIETIRIEKEAEEKYVILNFDNADIETVISTIGELLNINYIVAPGVTGKVTIQSYKKFPVKDLFQIFQTILEVNGLTAVKDGMLYRIVAIDTAKQQPLSVQSGKDIKVQLDSSFVTQIIPLEYVKASDVGNLVRNLMPRGADLIVYEPTNLLIVTAQPAGIVKFMKILEAIDISSVDRESIRTFVYHVENGEAKKLAEILKSLYSEKKDKSAPVKISPPLPTPLKGGAAPTTIEGMPGEVEGDVVITAYEDINGILIKSSSRNYLAILETLKKLDVPVRQVLIEVLIAEISLTDETRLGLEWMLKAPLHVQGEKLSTVSGFDSNAAGFGGGFPTGIGSAISTLPSATPFASVIKPDRYGAVLTAYATSGKVNVLASPHILAMDNKEANIQIGSEVPIATGLTQQPATSVGSTTLVSSGQIQYKTVGTLLTVKPHITEKERVTLEITQEVSQLGALISVAGQDFQGFNTRKAKTTAVVQSGHTLVLGGLITESKNKSRSGLPFLSKIPVLGFLFGTDTDTYTKTELLVMVTPHVVTNQDNADTITRDFQNKVKTINKQLEKMQKSESGKKSIISFEVEKDSSLMEIIEAHGFTIRDEDVNVFLTEFVEMNDDMKNIKMIPKGSIVNLPARYLKKVKK